MFDGIVCLVKLEPFEKRVVLPHEEPQRPRRDRFNLMKKVPSAPLSSIYSLYLDDERKIPTLLAGYTAAPPAQAFTDDEGVTHRLWKITDRADIDIYPPCWRKRAFIADGHHRYETALRFSEYVRSSGIENSTADYVMMTLGGYGQPRPRRVPDPPPNPRDGGGRRRAQGKVRGVFHRDRVPDVAEAERVLAANRDKHAFAFYGRRRLYASDRQARGGRPALRRGSRNPIPRWTSRCCTP